jgi:hypothetical protein
MGRWGGRSSDKAGLRDSVIAMDGSRYLLDENGYSVTEGGNVIGFDAAPNNPAQALQRRRETLTYQRAHEENEQRDREEARRAKLLGREDSNKPDPNGVVIRGGAAYAPGGVIVKPGGYYRPRGWFQGGKVFVCERLAKQGDKVIAVGTFYPEGIDKTQSQSWGSPRWFFPSDLKDVPISQVQRQRHQGRPENLSTRPDINFSGPGLGALGRIEKVIRRE